MKFVFNDSAFKSYKIIWHLLIVFVLFAVLSLNKKANPAIILISGSTANVKTHYEPTAKHFTDVTQYDPSFKARNI